VSTDPYISRFCFGYSCRSRLGLRRTLRLANLKLMQSAYGNPPQISPLLYIPPQPQTSSQIPPQMHLSTPRLMLQSHPPLSLWSPMDPLGSLPHQMDGAALLRCRLRHLLAEAGASITVPLPRRERLALLGALCSTVEELPEPELGQRLVTLARHEIDMLRAERHERAMLGVRNRIWLLLAEVVRAVADGDRATMMELRRAARHELRRGAPTSAVATLLRMVDDKGARLDTVAPSLQTGRRCPKDAWGCMPDICDTLPSQAQLCSMSVNFDGVRWQSAGLPLRRQSSGLLGRYGPN
jgi:hypothetical protein